MKVELKKRPASSPMAISFNTSATSLAYQPSVGFAVAEGIDAPALRASTIHRLHARRTCMSFGRDRLPRIGFQPDESSRYSKLSKMHRCGPPEEPAIRLYCSDRFTATHSKSDIITPGIRAPTRLRAHRVSGHPHAMGICADTASGSSIRADRKPHGPTYHPTISTPADCPLSPATLLASDEIALIT
jgi:hypothetical protein